jgi:hypothetical protein
VTPDTPTPALPPADLVAAREQFGAYARLVHLLAEVTGRIRPRLAALAAALDDEIAPTLGDDPAFSNLLMQAHAAVDAPGRLIDSLAGPLLASPLLPDLSPAEPSPTVEPPVQKSGRPENRAAGSPVAQAANPADADE